MLTKLTDMFVTATTYTLGFTAKVISSVSIYYQMHSSPHRKLHNRCIISNESEWSSIRSLIIRVTNKIGRPRNRYDFRQHWTKRSLLRL